MLQLGRGRTALCSFVCLLLYFFCLLGFLFLLACILIIFLFVFLFIFYFLLFLLNVSFWGGCYKDERYMQRYWKMIDIGIPGVKFPKNQEKKMFKRKQCEYCLGPREADGNKYRDSQADTMWRVRDLWPFSPKQDVSIKSLPSGLREPCIRGRKSLRVTGNGGHQEKKAF